MWLNTIDNFILNFKDIIYFKNYSFCNFRKLSIFCWELQVIYLRKTLDLSLLLTIIKSPYFSWELNSFLYLYLYNYVDIYYDFIINYNFGLFYNNWNNKINIINYFTLFWFFNKLFKINFLFFIIYTIFFLTYLENYIKQLIVSNNLVKLFILNENEKEIGSIDDFFFFTIFFILTLFSFIFISIISIIFHSSIFIWIFGSLILISVLILTIPLNLLIDFGISYFVYVKGSSISNNLIKELFFDIISVTIIFIRFLIQNIRFLFIFLAIFELLEWIFLNNEIFMINSYFSNNIFVNNSLFNYNFSEKNTNLLIINTILFIIFYFYYFLHLLFLLLVQIIIYIGISSWLFFFLYSTKFLGKYEKFFIYKKN
jgi:hypothetical protein